MITDSQGKHWGNIKVHPKDHMHLKQNQIISFSSFPFGELLFFSWQINFIHVKSDCCFSLKSRRAYFSLYRCRKESKVINATVKTVDLGTCIFYMSQQLCWKDERWSKDICSGYHCLNTLFQNLLYVLNRREGQNVIAFDLNHFHPPGGRVTLKETTGIRIETFHHRINEKNFIVLQWCFPVRGQIGHKPCCILYSKIVCVFLYKQKLFRHLSGYFKDVYIPDPCKELPLQGLSNKFRSGT